MKMNKLIIILSVLLSATLVNAQSETRLPADNVTIGKPTGSDPQLQFRGTTNKIRANRGTGNLEFSNDGSSFSKIGTNANVNTYTTTQVLTVANDVVLLDATSGAFTVTLPTAIGNTGKTIKLRRTDSTLANVITIACTGGQTVGGTSTKPMHTIDEMYEVVSNGTNWLITGRETKTPEADAGTLAVSSSANYVFTIPSASITSGTVYTANGNTFYVGATTSASVTLNCYGTGAPGASGTLVYVSGPTSGDRAFSATSTNAVVKGTAVYETFNWSRDGQYVNYRWDMKLGAGTQGSGDYGFFLPANLGMDTTNMQTNLIPSGSTVTGGITHSSVGTSLFSSSVAGTATWFAGHRDIIRAAVPGVGQFAGASAGNLGNAQSHSVRGSYKVVGWEP